MPLTATAVRLLRQLAEAECPLSPGELAPAVGMTEPLVRQLLRGLAREGFVTEQDGRYRLGDRIHDLARRVAES